MANDEMKTFHLFERVQNGQCHFVGRFGDLSVVIRPDRFQQLKPGEDPRWIATVKRSARAGVRRDG